MLLQQILRAHRVFLLHHSPSITELHARLDRYKFCGVLKAFWDNFLWNWDVLLHGNPAVDVFNGLKLAAGGELGIGVGEEEWGSGEREVLEGFIERTDGLVDLVVSRFGDAPLIDNSADQKSIPTETITKAQKTTKEWQGTTQDPKPSDGVIFSGIGAINRSSVRNISSWVEMLFKYGSDAYAIRDNPSSTLRRKRRKVSSVEKGGSITTGKQPLQRSSQPRQYSGEDAPNEPRTQSNVPVGIPPPIVRPARPQAIKTTTAANLRDNDRSREEQEKYVSEVEDQSASGTETLMKYLTLGVYGSQWGIPLIRSPVQRQPSKQESHEAHTKDRSAATSANISIKDQETSHGYFMIGLQGDLEEDTLTEEEGPDADVGTDPDSLCETQSLNNRTMRRTVHIERTLAKADRSSRPSTSSREHSSLQQQRVLAMNTDKEAPTEAYHDRLRVVVYVVCFLTIIDGNKVINICLATTVHLHFPFRATSRFACASFILSISSLSIRTFAATVVDIHFSE